MRRWDRIGISKEHFVEYNGKPVLSVKKAFRKVVQLAEVDTSIENVTPHATPYSGNLADAAGRRLVVSDAALYTSCSGQSKRAGGCFRDARHCDAPARHPKARGMRRGLLATASARSP